MRTDQGLILAAAKLASTMPREYQEFRQAFEIYARSEMANLLMAPPDAVQRMQGRAQQCASLSSLFEDPVNAASGVVKATAGTKAK